MRKVVALSLIAACGGGTSEPTKPQPIVPASSAVVGPSAFIATGSETFKASFRVFNSKNEGMPGVAVTFEASAGTLSATSAVTNATGTATVDWTLSNVVAEQTLTARVPNTTLRGIFTAEMTRSFVGRWVATVGGASFDITVASQTVDIAHATASLTGFATYRATASSAPVALNMIFGVARGDFCVIGIGLGDIAYGQVAYTFGGNLQGNDSTTVSGYINGSEFADAPFTMTRR